MAWGPSHWGRCPERTTQKTSHFSRAIPVPTNRFRTLGAPGKVVAVCHLVACGHRGFSVQLVRRSQQGEGPREAVPNLLCKRGILLRHNVV